MASLLQGDGPLSCSQQRHSRSLPLLAAAAPRTERQSRLKQHRPLWSLLTHPSLRSALHILPSICLTCAAGCQAGPAGGGDTGGAVVGALNTSRRAESSVSSVCVPPPPGSTRASEGSSGPPTASTWGGCCPVVVLHLLEGLGLPRDPLCSSAPTLALRTRSTLAHSEQDFHFPKHVICDRAPQCFYIPPLPLNVRGASGGYGLRRWTGNRRVTGSSPDR